MRRSNMVRKMKDSGIEWIGEIPEDWKISKIKYVSNLNGRIGFRGYKESDLVDEDEGAITLGPPNMDDGKLNLSNCKYLSWDKYFESPEIQLSIGDILLVKTASVGKVAYVDNIKKEMTINPQLLILKSKNIKNRFLFYVVLSDFFQNQIKMSVTGGTVPTLSQEKIGNFSITEPSLSSQKLIAKKLDLKCSKLEEVSNIIKKQIQTLEDYKKSVITEAVTKGLDKNVEMKDSGIEWIGEIPKHWSVSRIKYLTTSRSEKGNLSDTNKYIGLENVESKTGKYIKTDTDYIDAVYDQCKKGDLLYGKLRPNLNKVLISPFDASCTGEFEIIKESTIDKKWLYYYFLTPGFTNIVNSSTFGAKMPRASWDFIGNIKIAYPNDSEMQEIVSYIEFITSATDIAICSKQKQLEVLEEYKKSLIYEYVTGKKEVL